jgi:hypothetical protein
VSNGGKSDGPKQLGTILSGVVARLGIDRNLDDYRVWEAWDEVVGPQVARNAEPIRLDQRRLVVAVKSNGWMQELSLLRHDIRDRLNAWMRRDVVEEIFLVIGNPGKSKAARPATGTGRRAVSRLWESRDKDSSNDES